MLTRFNWLDPDYLEYNPPMLYIILACPIVLIVFFSVYKAVKFSQLCRTLELRWESVWSRSNPMEPDRDPGTKHRGSMDMYGGWQKYATTSKARARCTWSLYTSSSYVDFLVCTSRVCQVTRWHSRCNFAAWLLGYAFSWGNGGVLRACYTPYTYTNI